MTVAVASNAKDLGSRLTRLMEIAFGFVNSQALLSAQELGVFDALGNESMPLDALAGRIGLSPVACRRLLMVLVTLELVERDGDRFRNTELGRLCSASSDVNLGSVRRRSIPSITCCEHLTDALREYSPRWQQALGTRQDAFATLYADPVRLREFAELMNAISVPQGRLIAGPSTSRPIAASWTWPEDRGASRSRSALKHGICAGSSWTWSRSARWPENRWRRKDCPIASRPLPPT